MNNKIQLTDQYLDNYYFEMFTKAGEATCRRIVRAAWKKLAGKARITGEEMHKFLRLKMEKSSTKHPEIWDTEPREKIFYLVNKKAREYDYDYSYYFGNGF